MFYILHHLRDVAKFYKILQKNFTFLPWVLSFSTSEHPMTIELIKTCSVLKNNNKYRFCQKEDIVLFMWLFCGKYMGIILMSYDTSSNAQLVTINARF